MDRPWSAFLANLIIKDVKSKIIAKLTCAPIFYKRYTYDCIS